jgi:hypothetical protein
VRCVGVASVPARRSCRPLGAQQPRTLRPVDLPRRIADFCNEIGTKQMNLVSFQLRPI